MHIILCSDWSTLICLSETNLVWSEDMHPNHFLLIFLVFLIFICILYIILLWLFLSSLVTSSGQHGWRRGCIWPLGMVSMVLSCHCMDADHWFVSDLHSRQWFPCFHTWFVIPITACSVYGCHLDAACWFVLTGRLSMAGSPTRYTQDPFWQKLDDRWDLLFIFGANIRQDISTIFNHKDDSLWCWEWIDVLQCICTAGCCVYGSFQLTGILIWFSHHKGILALISQ